MASEGPTSTPTGRSIQADGIKPDIQLELLKVADAEPAAFGSIKESDLSGHLKNSQLDKEKDKDKDKAATSKVVAPPANKDDLTPAALAKTDYALYEALNMLRGMHIVKISTK